MAMDPNTMASLGLAGGMAALSIAAVGSALGTGTAGMAAIGAWKKCFAQGKSAPFLLLIFIGAPLSQTIYGMILMKNMAGKLMIAGSDGGEAVVNAAAAGNWPAMLIGGVLAGVAMAASALYQGRSGAAGADALAETGQGFANYLMTIGVVETVALFILVFIMGVM